MEVSNTPEIIHVNKQYITTMAYYKSTTVRYDTRVSLVKEMIATGRLLFDQETKNY